MAHNALLQHPAFLSVQSEFSDIGLAVALHSQHRTRDTSSHPRLITPTGLLMSAEHLIRGHRRTYLRA